METARREVSSPLARPRAQVCAVLLAGLVLAAGQTALAQTPFRLKDINPSGSSSPVGGASLGSFFLFAADDGIHGRELWRTDGTEAGTVLVKDIAVGAAGSDPGGFASVGSTVFFAADDGVLGRELWKSDGTESGTVVVADVAAGPASSDPRELVALNGRVYFAAAGGVWKTDGTAVGTALLRQFQSKAQDLTAAGSFVYFTVECAGTPGTACEFWRTDGSVAGTMSAPAGTDFRGLTAVGDGLFFIRSVATLDRVDDTRLTVVKSFPSAAGTFTVLLFEVAGSLRLAFNDLVGADYAGSIWRSDGTPDGTIKIADTERVWEGAPLGTRLVTTAGGSRNTVLVSDDGQATAVGSFPYAVFEPTTFDQWVVFHSIDTDLWRTDGTSGGTVILRSFPPGPDGGPAGTIRAPFGLFFAAADGVTGREPWVVPAAPGLAVAGAASAEGDSGSHDMVFTVTLSPPSAQTVVVNYATADGTATAGSDYQAVSGTLNFGPGVTTRTVSVPVLGDWIREPDESFTLVLSDASGAGIVVGRAGGAIQNDDLSELSLTDVVVKEPPTGGGNAAAVFTITLAPTAGHPVTVDWATADGTATAGSDYVAGSGTLTFAPGEATRTLAVEVTSDSAVEVAEKFRITLGNAIGATIAVSEAAATIVDNGREADFDGHAGTDILWRNVGGPDTGALFVWLMDGTSLSGTYLSPIDPAWVVAGVGDLDGNGKSDILWRESTTGDTYVWLMDGPVVVGAGYTNSQADNDWQIQALGDLDGNGRADIVWRKVGPGPDTGALFLWLMNGPAIVGGLYLAPISPDWQVQRLADLNGDGKTDFLWRERTTGNLFTWMMYGSTVIGAGYTNSQADNRWAVQATGDFDGDGKNDILWRNVGGPDTGALFVWLMDGPAIKGATYLDPISNNWQVQGTGDFNADGKSDILWRETTTGHTYIWMMSGPHVIAGTGYTASQADNRWQVQAPR